MNVIEQIEKYLGSHPEPKRGEMNRLHEAILELLPNARLWFLDGTNAKGKIVSNPNIGYGSRMIEYADGTSKEFYQIGLSANTSGISVYILGIDDRKYLAETYGDAIGKATVTGYCIRFRKLDDINLDVLRTAIRDGASR